MGVSDTLGADTGTIKPVRVPLRVIDPSGPEALRGAAETGEVIRVSTQNVGVLPEHLHVCLSDTGLV